MALAFSAFDADQGRLPQRARVAATVVLAALVFILAACDEEERRAVAPGAVSNLATVTSDDLEREVTESPPTRTGSLENGVLDVNLPRAERVYFANGGDVWQAPIEDDPVPVIQDTSVAGFSPSASGHRLAVLGLERGEGEGEEDRSILSLVLPDGSPVFDLSDFDDHAGLDAMSSVESVALTPAGNALAMTHRNGALTVASLDGQIQQFIDPEEQRQPGKPEWSSDGRFLAFLDPWLPNDPSGLYVLVPESGVRQVLVSASEEGHGVVEARWIPGTSNLVYSKTSGSTIPYGGDVFVVNAMTGERELLLSSSEIAPVAGAVDLAVSPDGEAVAVTAFVPGDENPEFAGLWMVSVTTGKLERVPVNRGQSVTDIWWLGENLLYRSVDEPRTRLPGAYTGLESFQLMEFNPDTGLTEERMVSEKPAR